MTDKGDALDKALAGLPKDVQPGRDLWPSVRSAIAAEAGVAGRGSAFAASAWRPQLAAAMLLALAASTTTYVLTRRSMQSELQAAAPIATAMPAAFNGESLGPEYVKSRAALDAEFERRFAALPPATRAKVASDLADLRRAANDIAAALAEHPSDPLLQELLMSTYRSELGLLTDVNAMTTR
ncbi:MAG TPA: hypothetical protein VHK24_13015, partial [Steroidobacter sp.]|nr:hypothetical protein [Steroidobacter sp.]